MAKATKEQLEWAEKVLADHICVKISKPKSSGSVALRAAAHASKDKKAQLPKRDGPSPAIKALATALAEREADGWRTDMENAPRDGERILLLGKTIHPCIDIGHVFWTEAYWEKMNGGGWVYYGAVAEWVAFKLITLPPAKETE
ncbi:hypothetical protein [Maritalea porphyrae]|uniref:hypothetical protein n=1 Tax=Maritalea porphyrae TaxID=880732 RepID=UPI0022AFBE35|nr:hypothetical protein [Maritalea porphyrae]MCZ4270940.1 hypothetical protein [Maritalea porphyrae]